MRRLVFDIEADGLLDTVTTIWCIVTKDLDTNHVHVFDDEINIRMGIDYLMGSDLLVGHNIIGYDLPLITKLTGIIYEHEVHDTLVMSKLFNPDRKGGHSLDSWGTRVGKDKPVHEDWSVYSPEMLHRCKEDVEINHLLYNILMREFI